MKCRQRRLREGGRKVAVAVVVVEEAAEEEGFFGRLATPGKLGGKLSPNVSFLIVGGLY